MNWDEFFLLKLFFCVQPPVPYGNWGEEIFDATKKIRLCLQYDPLWKKIDGVEDCLQLHIYSPNVKPHNFIKK